jgi:hypothetical protein
MIAVREGSSQSEGPSNAEGHYFSRSQFLAATAAQTPNFFSWSPRDGFWLVGAVITLVSPHCVRLFSGVFVLLFIAAVFVTVVSESDVALMATAPGTTASVPVVAVAGPSPAGRAATAPTSSGKLCGAEWCIGVAVAGRRQ